MSTRVHVQSRSDATDRQTLLQWLDSMRELQSDIRQLGSDREIVDCFFSWGLARSVPAVHADAARELHNEARKGPVSAQVGFGIVHHEVLRLSNAPVSLVSPSPLAGSASMQPPRPSAGRAWSACVLLTLRPPTAPPPTASGRVSRRR